MSPVRRAFVILLSVAAVIAFLLMLAQDQETLKVRSAISADDPRLPAYVAALVGGALSRGNRYDVLTNGDQIFPADARRRFSGAKRRISFETYIYDEGHGRRASSPRRSKRRRSAASRSTSSSTRSAAARCPKDLRERLEAAGCQIGELRAAEVVHARGAELPHPPQDPRRRRTRSDSPAASASPITGSGTRRTRTTGATRMVRIERSVARLIEGAFNENFIETAGDRSRRSSMIRRARSARTRGQRDGRCAARRPAAATI